MLSKWMRFHLYTTIWTTGIYSTNISTTTISSRTATSTSCSQIRRENTRRTQRCSTGRRCGNTSLLRHWISIANSFMETWFSCGMLKCAIWFVMIVCVSILFNRQNFPQINTNQGRFALTSTGDLQIVQVHKTDKGTYVCIADNGIGEPVEREVELNIAGKYKSITVWWLICTSQTLLYYFRNFLHFLQLIILKFFFFMLLLLCCNCYSLKLHALLVFAH